MNKLSLEILRNIELLCFVDIDKIKKFKDLIIKKLKGNKDLNILINYLEKYSFKLDPKIYNYTELIGYFKKNNGNKFLDLLYTTNNVSESINAKLGYY